MAAQKPYRLLFADDQAEMRNSIARILRLEDFEVATTSNGRKALDMLASEGPFDLLLLDINMPEVDGFTVLKTLRALPETKDLPVILVTGEVDTICIERCRQLGACDYLVKPYRIADLLARIQRGLSKD